MPCFTITADYKAGGYPSPTYSGSVDMEVNGELDEVEESAPRLLRAKVARSACFEPSQVKLSNVRVVRSFD